MHALLCYVCTPIQLFPGAPYLLRKGRLYISRCEDVCVCVHITLGQGTLGHGLLYIQSVYTHTTMLCVYTYLLNIILGHGILGQGLLYISCSLVYK